MIFNIDDIAPDAADQTLSSLRSDQGYTHNAAKNEIGVGFPTLTNWENADLTVRRRIKLEQAYRWMRLLGEDAETFGHLLGQNRINDVIDVPIEVVSSLFGVSMAKINREPATTFRKLFFSKDTGRDHQRARSLLKPLTKRSKKNALRIKLDVLSDAHKALGCSQASALKALNSGRSIALLSLTGDDLGRLLQAAIDINWEPAEDEDNG